MFDVVLQGPWHMYTPAVIDEYRKQDWIDKIIVSTWEGPALENVPDDVELIRSIDLDHPGVGNRNRQIKSSQVGLSRVEAPFVIKGRTDQIMYDLPMMKRFFDTFYDASAGPTLLFVLGLYYIYPFHTRDHLFMGDTHHVQVLYDVPYDPYDGSFGAGAVPGNYPDCFRSEAWIVGHYYARLNSAAAQMMSNPKEYIFDGAPGIQTALNLDFQMRDKLFKSFPRTHFAWPKYGLESYWYDVGKSLGEYWYEGVWE